MNWAAIYRWIVSSQGIFDWIYGTAAVCLVTFVFVEVLRGRILAPDSGSDQHIRSRAAEKNCIVPTSVPAGRLGLAELKLKDTPAQVFRQMAETK